jgi:hypothetical protein
MDCDENYQQENHIDAGSLSVSTPQILFFFLVFEDILHMDLQ